KQRSIFPPTPKPIRNNNKHNWVKLWATAERVPKKAAKKKTLEKISDIVPLTLGNITTMH
ncbi:11042_t:CDS:2, partial [Scutellospora calospora]